MKNALKFDKRVKLQKYTVETDDEGYQKQIWSTYRTVWARVFTVSGREFFSSATVNYEVKLRFVIRASRSLELSNGMRVVFQNQAFEVEALLYDDYENQTITLVTKGNGQILEEEETTPPKKVIGYDEDGVPIYG